jgi:hypothetical protein
VQAKLWAATALGAAIQRAGVTCQVSTGSPSRSMNRQVMSRTRS